MRSTVLLAAVLTLAAGGARAIQAQPTYDHRRGPVKQILTVRS